MRSKERRLKMDKTNTVEIKLHYGALADPLEEQLNKQGATLGKKREFIEKLQHGLIMCQFHLLTDAQYKSCLNKFHKKVMSVIQPLNK
jgi:hypothetical protein